MDTILLAIFWSAVGLIFYTYVGFPLLLAVRAWLFPKAIQKGDITPKVSLIIAAYNEEDVIEKKIQNILALDYPAEQLEFIVASDGSSDKTVALARPYADQEKIKLLDLPRGGKNQTLNSAIPHATGDILVFSDADAMLKPDALKRLIAPFNDPKVGGVGGDFRYVKDGDDGEGEMSYWNIDRLFKTWQSQAGSMTSATGQIFAIRRELFREVPLDTTDDFYISSQVPSAHLRLVFEPTAIATGKVTKSSKEFRRKNRIAVRGLTGIRHMKHMLNPFNYGFYAIQLLSHKILRRLVALPLLIILIITPMLWNFGLFYRAALMLQLAFHGLALTGYLLRNHPIGKFKLFSLPLFFNMVNLAMLIAVIHIARGKKFTVWTPQRTDLSNVSNQ